MALGVAEPEGGRRGGVVLCQEAFGVNSHISAVADRLAAAGYLTVVPHLYHRTGDPVVDYGEYAALGPHMEALGEAGLMADVDAAVGRLADDGIGPAATGIVGFCMGGTVAFLSAVRRRLGAAVTFYGGGVGTGRFGLPPLVELAPGLQTPWLGLYGDRDQSIPVADVEALAAAAARAPVETEVVRYGEAGHGFHCDERADYHEPSAADAWGRALEFFGRHLAG
ncbi:MAG: dienelactone hydrolase family protein [Acidobacteriota bacterium]|nr:dienelactone hydrolase family protein [Acidobacteriota bacterium]